MGREKCQAQLILIPPFGIKCRTSLNKIMYSSNNHSFLISINQILTQEEVTVGPFQTTGRILPQI
jgi:hypothetical protein